jgi:modulator of FtsH protease
MSGYATEGWSDLFVCAGGATAALSGLIFVSLSVNLRTLLDTDNSDGRNLLTGRAMEALAALLTVLVISIVGLTPDIGRGVLAAFILFTAAGSMVSPVRAAQASRGRGRPGIPMLLRQVTAIALTLTLLASGVSLAVGSGGGLLWLPAAFVVAITVAAINAWILLVEVMR